MERNLAYRLHKLGHTLYFKNIPILPYIIKKILRHVFACVVPPQVKIGSNTTLQYDGLGIVIHQECVIGNNVYIGTGVTLGNRTRGGKDAPFIGDNVYIGAGAKVLGGIKIGNNAKIGSNSVVLQDVPENVTVVGVPARIVKAHK